MEHERYGPAFMRAARYMARVYNRHLAEVLLTASQHGILEALGQFGPIALQDLADKLVIERSALQRTLQPLKTSRLVQSISDPFDKRRLLYLLTEEGQQALASSAARICSAEAEIKQLFAQSDIVVIRDNLLPAVDAFSGKLESIE